MVRTFKLYVKPYKSEEIELLLSQEAAIDESKEGLRKVSIRGVPLKIMMETLLSILKKQGYRPTEFSNKRKEPFELDEPSGVRLGVLMYSLKPLRKPSRMEQIMSEINRMSDEEVYYWYSKCSNKHHGRRAQRSLRILLSDE